MMSFAAILGACLLSGGLSVREENGKFSVVLGTVQIVESVSVVRGVADDADVRSSFAVRPDGTKVWNSWSEVRDRRFRLEVGARADGAVEDDTQTVTLPKELLKVYALVRLQTK